MLLEWHDSFEVAVGSKHRRVLFPWSIWITVPSSAWIKKTHIFLPYESSAYQDGSNFWVIAGAMDATKLRRLQWQLTPTVFFLIQVIQFIKIQWCNSDWINELIPNRYKNWDIIQTTSIKYGSIQWVCHGEFSMFYQWYMFYTVTRPTLWTCDKDLYIYIERERDRERKR